MESLMKYDSGRATAAFTELSYKLTAKTIPVDELWPRIDRLKFRDPDGRYWAPGLCSKRWFRHDGRSWRPEGIPAGPLEGPAEFAALAPAPVLREEEGSLPQAGEMERKSGSAGGAAVMEKIVTGIRRDYERGLYGTAEVERLLQDHYLIDRSGVVWSVGFATGAWYFHKDRMWVRSPAPDPGALPDPEELKAIGDDLHAALILLFASDEPVPEKAAPPWEPPAGIPEKPRFCVWCFGVNPADSLFCRLCGAPEDKLVDDPGELPRKIEEPEKSGQACPKCGRENDPDAGFCEQCGARIEKPAPAKNFCPSCGQKLEAGDLFCSGCGRKLG